VANNQQKVTWGGTLGLAGLVLAGCAVVVALATYMFGYVSGYEFNPQTFERRRFGFYEIPLVRLQVTPLWRNDASGAVEQLVRSHNYVTPTKGAPEQWDLISFRRSTYKPVPTDPLILQRYLDAQDAARSPFWQDWSVEHPDLAKILWPEVARLARMDLYVLLPPLFDLAREASDVKVFEPQLHKLQAQQLRENADHLKKRADEIEDADVKAALQKRAEELLKVAGEIESGKADVKANEEKVPAKSDSHEKEPAKSQPETPDETKSAA
jgi:hypothetical protein